jgi:hypothetical protein
MQVVEPSPEAAAKVEFVGATGEEETITRESLARLGVGEPVWRVVFSRHHKGRSVTAFVRKPSRRGLALETIWLGQLFLRDVSADLREAGVPVVWNDVRGDDAGRQPVTLAPLRRRSDDELRKVGEQVARRARAQGHRVTNLVGYPLASGGLKVAIGLTREEYLRGDNSRWLDIVPDRFGPSSYWAYIVVEGPGGTAAAYGANFGTFAGAFGFGPPGEGVTNPDPLDGDIALRIVVERTFPRRARFVYRLECGHSAACEVVRHKWTLLLPPLAGGVTCGGLFGVDELTIRGEVEGVPIRRHYSNCYDSTVGRWEELLGVPARRR